MNRITEVNQEIRDYQLPHNLVMFLENTFSSPTKPSRIDISGLVAIANRHFTNRRVDITGSTLLEMPAIFFAQTKRIYEIKNSQSAFDFLFMEWEKLDRAYWYIASNFVLRIDVRADENNELAIGFHYFA